jgi:hypothetical protein
MAPKDNADFQGLAEDALEVADRTIGEYNPSRSDPAYDALRVACFTVVLTDLLRAART